MGWEYRRFKAICKSCGVEGICIRGDDDWGRSSTKWEGFAQESPSSTSVGRKRLDARDMQAVCSCGSVQIAVENIPIKM
jgi:hypothetical protein